MPDKKSRPEAMVEIDGRSLNAEDAIRIARGDDGASTFPDVRLAEDARKRLEKVRDWVDAHWLDGRAEPIRPIYGFNTGVGALKSLPVARERLEEFQRLYIRSHCVGIGPAFAEDVVRAAILVRANSLSAGFSGIRPTLVLALLELLNSRIHPVVPCKGSLGASGDLAPLAHIGAVLQGEPGAQVAWPGGAGSVNELRVAFPHWTPIVLQAKEAMALTNGTSFMLALAVLLAADARRVLATADLAAALSLEAMRGEREAFDERLIGLRPQIGQQIVAANIRALVDGSGLIGRLHGGEPRVQDAYSLRCVPQVHGASRDAFRYLDEVVAHEINAVTDNPLIVPEGEGFTALSGGNFHGQPLAVALDLASLALAEIGSISERRLFRMLDPNLSYGLPPNLTGEEPGLNTGYMIAQYSAAALVSENRRLCQPASADSLPTSGNQEDHVSMGVHSGLQARQVLHNVEQILGIECLAACQGISLSAQRIPGGPAPGRGTAAAFHALRASGIPALGDDRYLKPEIDRAVDRVRDGSLLRAAEEACGLSFA